MFDYGTFDHLTFDQAPAVVASSSSDQLFGISVIVSTGSASVISTTGNVNVGVKTAGANVVAAAAAATTSVITAGIDTEIAG